MTIQVNLSITGGRTPALSAVDLSAIPPDMILPSLLFSFFVNNLPAGTDTVTVEMVVAGADGGGAVAHHLSDIAVSSGAASADIDSAVTGVPVGATDTVWFDLFALQAGTLISKKTIGPYTAGSVGT